MRKKRQLAMVLAAALAAVVPLWAQHSAHTSAPSHASAPSHFSAPSHMQAPRPSYGSRATSQPRGFAGAEPARAAELNHALIAQQHDVPRPPQNQQRPVARAPQQNAPRPGNNVPRPPQRNAVGKGGPQSAPSNSVPRPPQSNAPEPRVGNARVPSEHAPVIGTPRDVHKEPQTGDWLRHYSSMPPQQRERALESDKAFQRLSPQEQAHYRSQLNQFSSKSPQEQQRLVNRMDAWGHLTPQQQKEARSTYSELKAMPPDRQQQVNQAYRRLRGMPPSARQQVINSPEFQSRYSEQERNVILKMSDINNSLPH